MIEELGSLSILEDERAGKQFCGADAYKMWLTTQGLHADESGWLASLLKLIKIMLRAGKSVF